MTPLAFVVSRWLKIVNLRPKSEYFPGETSTLSNGPHWDTARRTSERTPGHRMHLSEVSGTLSDTLSEPL